MPNSGSGGVTIGGPEVEVVVDGGGGGEGVVIIGLQLSFAELSHKK